MSDSAYFVQLRERFPCIYNHSTSDYARKVITEQTLCQTATEEKLTDKA